MVWWVHIQIVFKNHGYCVLRANKERTIQVVTSAKFKRQHLWWCGGVLVPMAWITCTSVKLTLMPKGTNRFWSNICCQPDKVFFTNIPACNDKQHSADVRTGWLSSKMLLNWPVCGPDLPSIECVWCIVKCKIQQWRPQWATYTSTIGVLSSQTHTECCKKKSWYNTVISRPLNPTFLERVAGIKFIMGVTKKII